MIWLVFKVLSLSPCPCHFLFSVLRTRSWYFISESHPGTRQKDIDRKQSGRGPPGPSHSLPSIILGKALPSLNVEISKIDTPAKGHRRRQESSGVWMNGNQSTVKAAWPAHETSLHVFNHRSKESQAFTSIARDRAIRSFQGKQEWKEIDWWRDRGFWIPKSREKDSKSSFMTSKSPTPKLPSIQAFSPSQCGHFI